MNRSNGTSYKTEFHLLYAGYDHFEAVSKDIRTVLTVFGVLGHIATLLTMFRTKTMGTPSFIYLKALAFSELTYSANVLVVTGILAAHQKLNSEIVFPNAFGAYYMYVVNRIVSSITGYMIMYMTVVITFERFVALQYAHHYRRLNNRLFAMRLTLICLLLSDVFNSWHAFFENAVIPVNSTTVNSSVIFWKSDQRKDPPIFVQFTKIKDGYNMVLKMAYPIVVMFFVTGAILGFCRFVKNSSFLNANNRKIRREYTLVYFMIAIVILSFIQTVPIETRRLLGLIHPQIKEKWTTCHGRCLRAALVCNAGVCLQNFKMMLLHRGYMSSAVGLGNAIGRSCSFYLNIALNKSFRTAFVDQFNRDKPRITAESEYIVTTVV